MIDIMIAAILSSLVSCRISAINTNINHVANVEIFTNFKVAGIQAEPFQPCSPNTFSKYCEVPNPLNGASVVVRKKIAE